MEEERARRRIGNEAEGSTDKSGKRLRAERTVKDEEVEEFFSILKRLQEVKRLKSGRPSGDDAKRCKALWQPVFTLDDFKEITDGRRDRKDRANTEHDEVEVVSRSFDLNAEPEVESPRC